MDPHEKFASQTMSAASGTIMMYAADLQWLMTTKRAPDRAKKLQNMQRQIMKYTSYENQQLFILVP